MEIGSKNYAENTLAPKSILCSLWHCSKPNSVALLKSKVMVQQTLLQRCSARILLSSSFYHGHWPSFFHKEEFRQ